MKVCIAKYLYALIMILVFTAATAFGQVKVIHFNAGWNSANDVEWFDKLSDANKKSLSIDEAYKILNLDRNKKVTKEDIRNLVVGLMNEDQEEVLMEKDDRCTRIAKRKYDTWPSAYASGAVVRCRRGEIWKKEK